MPHDAMPLALAIDDSDEKLSNPHQPKGGSGLLAAFKATKREISARVARIGTKAILLTMITAAAALAAPHKAEAQVAYTVGYDAIQEINTTNNTLTYQNRIDSTYTPDNLGVAVSQDGNSVYVSEIASFSDATDAGVYIFDTQSQTFSNAVSVGTGLPGQLQMSSDGQSLYANTSPVGSGNPTGIAVLDTATNSVIRNITFPFAAPGPSGGVSFTPDQQNVYVINASNHSQIAEINVASGAVSSTFSLQYTYTDTQGVQHNTTWYASRIGFTTDGTEAYLEGYGQYQVNGNNVIDPSTVILVMNPSTNTTVTNIEVSSSTKNGNSFDGPIACDPAAYCYVTDLTLGSGVFVINASTNTVSATISDGSSTSEINSAAVTPDGLSLYLSPNGGPGITVINTTSNQIIASGIGLTDQVGIVFSSNTPSLFNPKTLGAACDVPGGCAAGDPITVGTGNVFEQVTDYTTAGQNPLSFTRYYNSLVQELVNGNSIDVTSLGLNWRSNFDRGLLFTPSTGQPTIVNAIRPDGQVLTFTASGSNWVTDSDVDVTLTQNGTTWTLTDHDDTVETYPGGVFTSIQLRNGYTQTLSYSSTGFTVTDSYNRTLNATYNSSFGLQSVTTPDGLTLTYGYTNIVVNGLPSTVLGSVTYSTVPATSIQYVYENPVYPYALTGVIDENNNRYKTWTYDNEGRGQTSQVGNGTSAADLTTVTYNANGTTTVTNAFGVADTYTFTTLQGVSKVSQISRAATSTTAAATETFGYDTNGYLSSQTDWNGNQTTFANDTHGDPTTINYAVGSPVAYSVRIQYDTPTFPQLPEIITAPGVTSTYNRDGNGNPLSRTDVDTTTTTVPYSTNGQSRETQWTWTSTGQELSVQLPRTDVTAKTQFGYTGGTLTSITDALGHETQITQYTGGGLPLTVIDPNNVTTTNTYDLRLNLHTSTLSTTAGPLTTTWTYNAANELQSLEQPDGSTLTFGYDTAHRLTGITDLLGNSTTITLDALGGATATNVKNTSGTVKLTHSAVFDALDRITSDIGGVGQTTKYAYDPMSNVLTITPPSPSGVITQTPDALNRLATRTDPAPGGTTTFMYDSFNRPLSVQDANGNTTSYVNDGFGDRIQTASPDSGTSVFYYNPDRDLTKSVLPGSLTMNATFDALDRNLTVKYTGDTTLNVSNSYDQTGHGFGIGRLTSAADQVGSLSLTYDERGNITNELRTPTGLAALNTSTAYDAASNVASITYPDGNVVTNNRDSMGKVTSVTSKPSGASSATTIASGITYEPLPEFAATGAPPVTGLSFGNGVTGSYGYDLDYRPTTRVDTGTATVQNLTYAYFANDSVKTITDAVNAANTQNMTYDTLDRLKTATSGTGGYGTYGFTWDPVSNIKTETVNGTETTYHLASGTNRLSGFVTGTTTETVTTSASGNITKLAIAGVAQETLTYNKANELATSATASNTASYAFDEFGKRLKEVGSATSTSTLQYDDSKGMGPGSNLLTDTDGAGNSRVDYIYLNGTPIGSYQPSNNKFYFISTDRLGTPAAVTDSAQAIAWTATYQPFGNTTTGASGIVQNLRLPGQEWDLESTLNHNGFRDYATTLTRYVQSDPIGLKGGLNTYQYAKGNAFKFTDRPGLFTNPNWINAAPVPIGGSSSGANPSIGQPLAAQQLQEVVNFLDELSNDSGYLTGFSLSTPLTASAAPFLGGISVCSAEVSNLLKPAPYQVDADSMIDMLTAPLPPVLGTFVGGSAKILVNPYIPEPKLK